MNIREFKIYRSVSIDSRLIPIRIKADNLRVLVIYNDDIIVIAEVASSVESGYHQEEFIDGVPKKYEHENKEYPLTIIISTILVAIIVTVYIHTALIATRDRGAIDRTQARAVKRVEIVFLGDVDS